MATYKVNVYLIVGTGSLLYPLKLSFIPYKGLILEFSPIYEDEDDEVFKIKHVHYKPSTDTFSVFLEEPKFESYDSAMLYKDYLKTLGFK